MKNSWALGWTIGVCSFSCHTTQQSLRVPTENRLYLRAAPDSNPRDRLGRWFDDTLPPEDIDESKSTANTCSRYFATTEEEAAGGLDSLMSFNSAAGLAFNVKPIASIAGNIENKNVALVRTTNRKKLSAVPVQPELDVCCSQAGCPKRYIVGMIAGSGAVFSGDSMSLDAGVAAEVAGEPASGNAFFSGSTLWRRAQDLAGQYYAFEIAQYRAPEKCYWKDLTPQSNHALYFIGISSWAVDEALSREEARRNATQQLKEYLGAFFVQETQSSATTQRERDLVAQISQDKAVEEQVRSGLVAGVENIATCSDTRVVPDRGTEHKAKVLFRVENDKLGELKRMHRSAIIQTLRQRDKLTPELERALGEVASERQP